MTFEDWKFECNEVADQLGLGLGDLWEKDDPYDLFEAAESMWDDMSPDSFVRYMFDDDIARMMHDEEQAAEAWGSIE